MFCHLNLSELCVVNFCYSFLIGNGESLHAEEYEGDKIDPLPDWSPSRENELPPKVDLRICMPCTPSYCRLPEDVNIPTNSFFSFIV
jgi:hypothetical protein